MQMIHFVEENQILKEITIGIRRETTTTDALVVFTEFLRMKTDQGF